MQALVKVDRDGPASGSRALDCGTQWEPGLGLVFQALFFVFMGLWAWNPGFLHASQALHQLSNNLHLSGVGRSAETGLACVVNGFQRVPQLSRIP